jgi:hypothetical protein
VLTEIQVTTLKRVVTEDHKKALQLGRIQSAAVRSYLESIRTQPKKRGRKITEASITAKIERLKQVIENPSTSAIKKLQAISESHKLHEELTKIQTNLDTSIQEGIERGFVEHAKAYGEAHGIRKEAWLEFGVDPKILAEAGIR